MRLIRKRKLISILSIVGIATLIAVLLLVVLPVQVGITSEGTVSITLGTYEVLASPDIERQSPDTAILLTNLDGTVSDIQDDPDSPDANWLTHITNNVDTVCRVSFPTPTGNPTVGADLQEFKIWVRQQPDGAGADPTVRIELYEYGTGSLGVILADTAVSSTTGALYSGTWNANLLNVPDGSYVECYIYGTAVGGAPGNRCTIEVGAVEWNVTYDVGGDPDIVNAPADWTLNGIVNSGVIQIDTVYYANPSGDTTPPNTTVADGDCRFTITNSSTMAIDLTVTMGNFSGGSDNMTNSNTGANGATAYGAYSWFSGDLYANKVIIKSTGSSVGKDGLAALTDIKWGAEVETQTNPWTGGTSSTATLTITATVD